MVAGQIAKQELDYVRNNKWDPGEFIYAIERLDIYQGRFAIIDGTGDAEKYTYKSSNVFIKVDGEWKAIASHVSGYKEKQGKQPRCGWQWRSSPRDLHILPGWRHHHRGLDPAGATAKGR